MQPTDTLETQKPKRVKLSEEERASRRKESNRKSREKLLAKNPDYHRNRAKAIKEGKWQFRNAGYAQPSTDAAPCSSEPPGAS